MEVDKIRGKGYFVIEGPVYHLRFFFLTVKLSLCAAGSFLEVYILLQT